MFKGYRNNFFLPSVAIGLLLAGGGATGTRPPYSCWVPVSTDTPGCRSCPNAEGGVCPEFKDLPCFGSELECCSRGGINVQATRLCRARFQELVDIIEDAQLDGLPSAAVTLPEGEVISMSSRPNREIGTAVTKLKNPLLDMSANVYYTAQCTVDKTCHCAAGGPCCCCTHPNVPSPTETPTAKPDTTPSTSIAASTTHPCSANYTLDLLYLQENSWSFHDYLPAIKEEVPSLLEDLKVIFGADNFRAGMASFVDKPIEPLGQFPYDYCYWSHVELGNSTDTQTSIENEVKALQSFSGRDGLEGQLHGLLYGALQGKWDPRHVDDEGRKILRIMWMSTESGWHEAGDADFLPPHPGDAEDTYCGTHDYPSRSQVSEAILAQNIYVIILVPHEKVRVAYTELLKDMNVTGGVYMVNDNWHDIVNSFLEAMTDFCVDGDALMKRERKSLLPLMSGEYDPNWLIDDDEAPQPEVEGSDIKNLPYSHSNQVGPFEEVPSTQVPL